MHPHHPQRLRGGLGEDGLRTPSVAASLITFVVAPAAASTACSIGRCDLAGPEASQQTNQLPLVASAAASAKVPGSAPA